MEDYKSRAGEDAARVSKFSQTDFKYLKSKTQGRWYEILELLGVNPVFLTNTHGPCPVCGGRDRYRFDNRDDKGTFFCNNCGAGSGFKLLQLFHGWSFKETFLRVSELLKFDHSVIVNNRKYIHHQKYKKTNVLSKDELKKRRHALSSTWHSAKSITLGDQVDIYLKNRGIELGSYPMALRYHPRLRYYEGTKLVGKYPVLIGLVRNPDNKPISIHRTYLNNGAKANVRAPKKLMPPVESITGGAIRLFEPINESLALAEGIETALAFHVATNLPIWVTISANGLEKVILPPSIKKVIVCVDNDESGAGQKAALNLSRRLIREGRQVKRIMPPSVGCDFADMLQEVAI